MVICYKLFYRLVSIRLCLRGSFSKFVFMNHAVMFYVSMFSAMHHAIMLGNYYTYNTYCPNNDIYIHCIVTM